VYTWDVKTLERVFIVTLYSQRAVKRNHERNSKRWAIALWAAPLIVVARPCSESDIYPGYPLPKDREFGSVRPYLPVSDGLLAA
jgi:hypothetical protein